MVEPSRLHVPAAVKGIAILIVTSGAVFTVSLRLGTFRVCAGRKFLCKVNANIGNSAVSSSIEEARPDTTPNPTLVRGLVASAPSCMLS